MTTPGREGPPDKASGVEASRDATRLAAVTRAEGVLTVLRLLVLLPVAGLFTLGDPVVAGFQTLACLVLAFHAGYAYRAHRIGQYERLRSPWSFALHLVTVACLVYLSGAERSPLAALFPALVVGLALYTGSSRRVAQAALVCGVMLAALAGLHALAAGMPPETGYLVAYLVLLAGTAALLWAFVDIEPGVVADPTPTPGDASLRTMLDSMPGPTLVYDADEFITEANELACELAGLAREDLEGRRFRALLFDDGTLGQKLASLKSRGWYRGEALLVAGDGTERNVDLRIRSFVHGGRPCNVVSLNDITSEKGVRETARLGARRLEESNRELHRVQELRTAFFGTVSQRLRSPLTAILGFTDLLLAEDMGPLNARQRRVVQSCRRSVLRAFNMVDSASRLKDATSEQDEGPD